MTANPLTTLSRLTFDAPDDAALGEGVRAIVPPGFTFRQKGHRTDVDGLLAHLHELRGSMSSGEVTLLDELVDRSAQPPRAAARTTARMHRERRIGRRGGIADDRRPRRRPARRPEMGRYLQDGDDRPGPTPTA